MMSAAHSDNRRAKASRLAALLFANSISAERWSTATSYQWSLIEEMDARQCRRKAHEPSSEATRQQTLAALRDLELADFRVRLKAMRRFCRAEQRRIRKAKENQ
jgi:hypothetical protein